MNSYKALFISDIHFSNKLPYAKPATGGRTDRLLEQIKMWKHVLKTCEKDERIEEIWILGDLADKSIADPVVMTAMAACLGASKCRVNILPGNHEGVDAIRGGRFLTEAFGAFQKDGVISLNPGQMCTRATWLTFWCLPFCSKDEAQIRISKIVKDKENQEGVHILLMHHSINGCEHGDWICDDGLDAEFVTKNFNYTLSGHFHESQKFGANGMYLGAPMHHRFDDVGRRAGYWVMTFFEDGTRKKKFIDPGCAKFFLMDSVTDKIPEDASPERHDFIRWRIRGTKEDWKKMEKLVFHEVNFANKLGFRADHLFKPIPVIRNRMSEIAIDASDVTDLKPRSLENQISGYVEQINPELDIEKLKEIGRNIYLQAKHAHA